LPAKHIARTWSLLDEKLGTNAPTMARSSGELWPPRDTAINSAPSVLCNTIERASTNARCFCSTDIKAPFAIFGDCLSFFFDGALLFFRKLINEIDLTV